MSAMFASAPVALKAVVADRGGSRRKSLPRVVTVRNSVAEGATKTSAAKTGDRQKAIVVGGGVGGLGMASRLAHAGYDVTILEKNEDTGGRARSEFFGPDADASGWRFDTGPSLMLLPDRYREQFTAVGKKLEDYMDIERVDPAYRAHFGDHTSLDLLYDTEKMRKQLDEVEFCAGGRYIDWLGRARASLDYGVAAFIERDANSILDFVDLSRVGPLALAVNPLDLLLPQFQQMKKYFKSPKLRALFSYKELYVGLSPYNAPGVFSLLAATELTDGVWYPKGGFDKVRGSLQALCDEEGVEIRTGTSVESIVTEPLGGSPSAIAGSKATQVVKGVKLASGEIIEADVVVANPDLPCVWDQMIDKEVFPEAKKEAERWEDADYSASVIEFNWCLDTQIADLLHHNVFLSGDYEGSWVRPCVASDFDAPKQHNFYCHNPVFTDPTCAPPGGFLHHGPAARRQHQRAGEDVQEARAPGAHRGGDGRGGAGGYPSKVRGSRPRRLAYAHQARERHHTHAVEGEVQHQARGGVRAVARFDAAGGVQAPGADVHRRAGFSLVRRASLRGRFHAAGQRRAAGAHGRKGCVRRHHQDARRRGEGHAR